MTTKPATSPTPPPHYSLRRESGPLGDMWIGESPDGKIVAQCGGGSRDAMNALRAADHCWEHFGRRAVDMIPALRRFALVGGPKVDPDGTYTMTGRDILVARMALVKLGESGWEK